MLPVNSARPPSGERCPKRHPQHPANMARRAFSGEVFKAFGPPPGPKAAQALRDAECELENEIDALIDVWNDQPQEKKVEIMLDTKRR